MQRHRKQYARKELEATGLELQTVMYRAPEVLFNEQDYGVCIDSWSIGLVLAEVNGWTVHRVRPRKKEDTRKELKTTLLRVFRLPEAPGFFARPRMNRPPHEHDTIH